MSLPPQDVGPYHELSMVFFNSVREDTRAQEENGVLFVEMSDGTRLSAIRHSDLMDYQNSQPFPMPSPAKPWVKLNATGTESKPKIMYLMVEERQPRRRASANSTYVPWIDENLRVVVNEEGKPLRWSPLLPMRVETDVPGWYMEVIMLLDSNVRVEDFQDRMCRGDTSNWRPELRTLQGRRHRDRDQYDFEPCASLLEASNLSQSTRAV